MTDLQKQFSCHECEGTGIYYERHDYADEPLGCPECEGRGTYDALYAFEIGRLIDRETINYEAGVDAFHKAWKKAVIGGTEGGFDVAFKIAVDAAVGEDRP